MHGQSPSPQTHFECFRFVLAPRQDGVLLVERMLPALNVRYIESPCACPFVVLVPDDAIGENTRKRGDGTFFSLAARCTLVRKVEKGRLVPIDAETTQINALKIFL